MLKGEGEITCELHEVNNEALQKVRMLKGDLYGEELADNELNDYFLEEVSGGREPNRNESADLIMKSLKTNSYPYNYVAKKEA